MNRNTHNTEEDLIPYLPNGAAGIQHIDVKLLQIKCAMMLFDEVVVEDSYVKWGGKQNGWTPREGEKRKELSFEKFLPIPLEQMAQCQEKKVNY